MKRRDKLVKKTYYSLVVILPFWKRLEKERKKHEMDEKLEIIKEQKDRFWQGFLEQNPHRSDPSDRGISVHIPMHRPDMTRKHTPSSGIAETVNMEC